MEFTTNISASEGGEHRIYGKPVDTLMRNHTYTEVVFLLLSGKLPSDAERALLDSMLVAASEHGVEAPSLYAPRVSVASGNDIHVGMATGILAIGSVHGGAGEASAMMLARSESAIELVAEYIGKKERMPGFGHMVYKDEDPRATIIFEKAKAGGLPLAPFEKAYAIEKALETAKGKKLPLNIDGAFAAATLSLGLDTSAAKALFVLARTAGMAAHAIEESRQSGGYHRLPNKK